LKLPYLENLFIPEDKIKKYLLNLEHVDGRDKAIYFMKHGYTLEEWERLANDLYEHAKANQVVSTRVVRGGLNYSIEGYINAPDGLTIYVRGIWYIEDNDTTPRLVSAYPA
jgi:hypothetical protein